MNEALAVAIDWMNAPSVLEEPGVRVRAQGLMGHRCVIVEYDPGAHRSEWCTIGHLGLVLEGRIDYELENTAEILRVHAGNSFVLPPSFGHKARNPSSEMTKLFIVDLPT